jgi:hypothetical protein
MAVKVGSARENKENLSEASFVALSSWGSLDFFLIYIYPLVASAKLSLKGFHCGTGQTIICIDQYG